MDRLQSMRVFQQVVDEGGFAAAGRKLDMSPAMVTRLVGDLEEYLGVRLLQRTTRRLSLTDAGEAYLARVRSILSDIDEAHGMVQTQAQQMAGQLRILAPPVLAVHILAPLVAEFRRMHPRVQIDVHVDAPAHPAVEDYDLTMLGGNMVTDANVIVRTILTTEGVLCASPEYLRRHGVPQAPADLADHLCLRLKIAESHPRRWHLINPQESGLETWVDVDPALLANHSDFLLRATLEGAGVSSQPLELAAPHLQDGRLKRVLAPWITGRFALRAALPSRKFTPVRTRTFLDFMVERTRALISEAQRAVR